MRPVTARPPVATWLSPRQLAAVREYVLGGSRAAAAAALGIARGTVAVHLRRAYATLGVHHRADLVRWSLRAGVVEMDEWMEEE